MSCFGEVAARIDSGLGFDRGYGSLSFARFGSAWEDSVRTGSRSWGLACTRSAYSGSAAEPVPHQLVPGQIEPGGNLLVACW